MSNHQNYKPPVIVVMGHVDHGKTTLLDTLRKSSIASGEAGAITQKIGAYEVLTEFSGFHTNKFTMIDTPGHEAFSKLRERGSSLADIALLVIDSNESVKPQTIESIEHIIQNKIPFIVVLSKSDLPGANPDKIAKDLLRHHVILEKMGGKVPSISISAKKGTGIKELLELILLMASDLNLSFDPKASPSVVVLETQKTKAGVEAHCLITQGILKRGDTLYFGPDEVKTRALINDTGKQLSEVQPSTPFVLLGCKNIPPVGTVARATPVSQEAKTSPKSLDKFDFNFMNQVEFKKLRLVIKVDNQGSLEAIQAKLSANDELEIISINIGDITNSDVFTAKTTGAIIVGFAVKVESIAKKTAQDDKVVIKTYDIIYELLEELQEVGEFFRMKQEVQKRLYSEAKIVAEFVVEGERIAGVNVSKGTLEIGEELELYRGEDMIGKTKLVSLKQRAKNVRSIPRGDEGGAVFSPPLDFLVGDVVKCYRI